MKKATFTQGYDLTPEGDQTLVSFRSDGISWAGYIVFPLIFTGLSTLFGTPFWPLPLVLILGVGYLIYLMFQRQTFTLTPDGIIKNGAEYERDKISEVLIDNPMDKEVTISGGPSMIIGGTGAAGASMAVMGAMANATTSAALGANMAIARSSAKRRFRVRIRYGSKVVTLGRNLKRDRAIAIFDLLTQE
ncbi:hypothetical protein DC366_19035 [Pelagivirga sediminicola]|uniref:DUF304 domain-containing protein n=1 Tax=Pelagivirga sediminicola TaxID=2170575 RepID=A0A2T7G232_9RHOB|nr:hypothetical protein [Pelagivirga sediminicola]PVA08482.1 hypothetical protein DC366_19035 [Pelagivirga sediminicola]